MSSASGRFPAQRDHYATLIPNMQVETQIEKSDLRTLRSVVVRTLVPTWVWSMILILVAGVAALPLDARLRHSSTAMLAVAMVLGFLYLLPVAAERGLAEEIRYPYAPFVLYALVVGVIVLGDPYRSDLAWAGALIGQPAVLAGFGMANWRRRSRLLGPIKLATNAAGVDISRRSESVHLPWDQLKFREVEGNFVIGTETPWRWFVFPKRSQSSLWNWDLLQELGSHAQPVSAWPWPSPWGL